MDSTWLFSFRKPIRTTWGPRQRKKPFFAPTRTVEWRPWKNITPPYTAAMYGFCAVLKGFENVDDKDLLVKISFRYDDVFDTRKPLKVFTKVYLNCILEDYKVEVV